MNLIAKPFVLGLFIVGGIYFIYMGVVDGLSAKAFPIGRSGSRVHGRAAIACGIFAIFGGLLFLGMASYLIWTG